MSLKTVLAGALLLASGTTLQAQEINFEDFFDNRYEIIAGWGLVPMTVYYESGIYSMDYCHSGPETLQQLYDQCYDASYSMTYSCEFAYHIKNRWDLCASMGYATVTVDHFDPFSNEKLNHEDLFTFDIQVGARRYYVAKRAVRLYSQITLGACFMSKSDFWDQLIKYGDPFTPKNLAFQVTGMGITVGKKVIGSLELGWGTDYMQLGILPGFKLGLGYRF